jgi:hypothetical protein
MSTYSTHRQVTGSGHPLNQGLGGYCRGKVPWVPWVIGYGLQILGMTSFLERQMAEEPYTSCQEIGPTTLD